MTKTSISIVMLTIFSVLMFPTKTMQSDIINYVKKDVVVEAKVKKQSKSKTKPKTKKKKVVSRGGNDRYVDIILTAYCSCAKCCGTYTNRTATGAIPRANYTVAGPSNLLGSDIYIDGIGKRHVEDTGSAIKWVDGSTVKIDVYFNSHSDALEFGKRKTSGYIEVN